MVDYFARSFTEFEIKNTGSQKLSLKNWSKTKIMEDVGQVWNQIPQYQVIPYVKSL